MKNKNSYYKLLAENQPNTRELFMQSRTVHSFVKHRESIIHKLKEDNALSFSDLLSNKSINNRLVNTPYRERIFSPSLTVYGWLSQVLNSDQSCQAAVAQIIAYRTRQGKVAPSANTAAYCAARSRLPEEVLPGLAKDCAQELEKQASSKWLWRNREVKIVDGTTVSMPDTAENQKMYPQTTKQKKGVGFPIARLVGITSLSTGALLDLSIAAYSGKKTGEHALFRDLLGNFKSGDIVLADAYYSSFFCVATLMRKGVDFVFPQHGSRRSDFRKGKRLGKKDHLAEWKKPTRPEWMDEQTYATFPEKVKLRETLVTKAPRRGYRVQSRVIITSFHNAKEVTAEELSQLYGYRWFIELDLCSLKEVMKMDILRSKTPAIVCKEIWAHVLAYNLIRGIMAQAAIVDSNHPRQMSFKLALQMITSFRQAGLFEDNEIHSCLLKALVHKKVGNRPERSEPRMVKRRPKPFPRLQNPRSFYQKKAA